MSKLIKRLFCKHRYKEGISQLFSYEENNITRYHIYTCCKCGYEKILFMEV